MSEPSRLELLHFTRRVVMQQATAALRQIDRWIADSLGLRAVAAVDISR
ncbi:hypothetical protein [Streptomyces anthocyanicus]